MPIKRSLIGSFFIVVDCFLAHFEVCHLVHIAIVEVFTTHAPQMNM